MIYFLGDVHGRIGHVLPAIQRDGAHSAHVIFLGDIDLSRPFEEEIRPLLDVGIGVWFIHGNHDTDQSSNWDNLQNSMHRSLDGRIVEIEGERVAGLGGVFRGEIWYPDRGVATNKVSAIRNHEEFRIQHKIKTPPRLLNSAQSTGNALKHCSSIFPDTYDRLANQKADILVTHEAPSCHKHGFQTLDLLAQVMGVRTLFHGHHHVNLDYPGCEQSLGFQAYGVGLRAITDINGRWIVRGQSEVDWLYEQMGQQR
ncbi:metallophosphoesterase [Alcaligenaceae bacterium CGII-47]|nr:metallophosphoesterase [Alcaligenaceae bacterium CGII-47]